MEMRKVFFMNGDGVITLKMVNEGNRYFDLVHEEEYTEEELRRGGHIYFRRRGLGGLRGTQSFYNI